MVDNTMTSPFSELYGRFRALCGVVRERAAERIPESALQALWYDQMFGGRALKTDSGKPLRVISPGWWNHSEGPDFREAQIEFNGEIRTGDVEIHINHAAWFQHGHHLDKRYDNVLLGVALDRTPPARPPVTSERRVVATLSLGAILDDTAFDAAYLGSEELLGTSTPSPGKCALLCGKDGVQRMLSFVELAGDWRMLHKSRAMGERMERVGDDQAVYEHFMMACGYSRFKHHFQALARHMHYDRARQLARQDPFLLETALLQMAGLLPDALPGAPAHFERLRSLCQEHLAGLRSLPLVWRRVGVRPNNNPERRLAGAARFLARTSKDGLVDTVLDIWRAELKPLERRRAFEALFPGPIGFWAQHCAWTAARASRPSCPLGAGRVRSIIGNVFIPLALAAARRERDRTLEESVFAFYAGLPKEADNHVLKVMIPRLLGSGKPPNLGFRHQQGMLQVYQDWCAGNPSCHQCPVTGFLPGAR